jgi:hypothetical protein
VAQQAFYNRGKYGYYCNGRLGDEIRVQGTRGRARAGTWLGRLGKAGRGQGGGGLARLDRGKKTGDQRQREMWLYWIEIQDVA